MIYCEDTYMSSCDCENNEKLTFILERGLHIKTHILPFLLMV